MLDHKLRLLKDRALTPAVRALAKGLDPNAVSWFAFALGVASAMALWYHWVAASLVLWLLNRVFDGIDGLVARLGNRVSDFGGYLDILLDFVVYAALPAALIFRSPDLSVAWAGFVLMAVFYINAASWMYLAALLEKRGRTAKDQVATSTLMPAGLVEGAETIIFYTLMILLPEWTVGLFLVLAGLTLVGALLRFGWAVKALRNPVVAESRRGPQDPGPSHPV